MNSSLRFTAHVSRLAHYISRFTFRASYFTFRASCFTFLVLLIACNNIPIIGGSGKPTPSRQIDFDGPVTLTVHAGETLVGTTIAYQGKAQDGRAIMSINGQQALKATADSVKWTGALVLFSVVDLNLRVVTYDESNMTLAGTIHIIVQEPNPMPAIPSQKPMATFTVPLTYTVSRNSNIPGTIVGYVGAKAQGAEFTNLDQFPYRDRFDSVVWEGRLRERIAVRYELRVLDYNDERVVLGGTANVIFEP